MALYLDVLDRHMETVDVTPSAGRMPRVLLGIRYLHPRQQSPQYLNRTIFP